MNKPITFIFLLPLLISFSFIVDKKPKEKKEPIKIEWTTLTGDFSFTQEWEYPMGVFKNSNGQLICDGLCPDGLDSKRDSLGRIYPDSLAEYYALVDTTHRYRTLEGDAWCYEYGEAHYAYAHRIKDAVICQSECNASTHCSLVIEMRGDDCVPKIMLNSVTPAGERTYFYEKGFIRIDKEAWKQSVLKAEFYFTFKNIDGKEKMYWKGLVCTKIEELKF